jgi:hypothetical protein
MNDLFRRFVRRRRFDSDQVGSHDPANPIATSAQARIDLLAKRGPPSKSTSVANPETQEKSYTHPAGYIHPPLGPGSRAIRMLFLHPALDNDDEIRCSLHPGNLDDLPEYKALSYGTYSLINILSLQDTTRVVET